MQITGQEHIADVFGVAPKTIVEWQEDGFPIATRGGPGVASVYDSAECIRWYVAREMNRAGVELPRDRLFRLQAESIELDLAVKRGHLIPSDQLEPRFKAVMIAAREYMRNEASRLAGLTEGVDRQVREDLLRETFDGFLRKLSRWEKATTEDPLADDHSDDDDDPDSPDE